MSKISTIDALKIQARAVAPIVRALESVIGTEAAHELVGTAIADSWAEYIAQSFSNHETPAGAGSPFGTEEVLITDTPIEYRKNITKCEAAEYFRSKGMPDIGALLSCGLDFAVERNRCPDWDFSRSQTLMLGADHCDFCWKKR